MGLTELQARHQGLKFVSVLNAELLQPILCESRNGHGRIHDVCRGSLGRNDYLLKVICIFGRVYSHSRDDERQSH